jgi:hypothetical protein
MNSTSLEVWQVQRLFDRVQHDLNFLNRLEGRMQQKHFPLNDPLLLAVKKRGRRSTACRCNCITY